MFKEAAQQFLNALQARLGLPLTLINDTTKRNVPPPLFRNPNDPD
jgi:hypothetical protein